jgi:hypothetical protein
MRKLGAEMRKLGADAMVVENFLHVRWGASAAKATKDVREAWAALAEARGASYEAALRKAEASYDEEWKAAAGSADKQKAAKVKLLAALIAAERDHSKQIQEEIKRRDSAYAEQTRSQVAYLSTVYVSVRDSREMAQAVPAITEVLRERHRLRSGAADDFTVQSQSAMLEAQAAVSGTFTLLLGSIGGISLLVGGIGILAIMLIAVRERTREIGLRRAVGARRRDILLQFLIETGLLSLLGGVIGVVLASRQVRLYRW